MSSLVLRPHSRAAGLLDDLLARHRALALYGIAMLALGLFAIALQPLDPRLLASGVNVWVKPAKFFLSVGVFALTAAWFFGLVRPQRRHAPALRAAAAVLIGAASFELAYIAWQAAHAQESHFNTATPFHAVLYALMGIGALLLVATTLPLAWEIARRPAPGLQGSFVAAAVAGLVVTFVLGGGLALYMSGHGSHAVGAEGGHLPVFGWNRQGGDLRIAHFLGIHAEQALPLLGALAAPLAARTRAIIVAAGTAAYGAATLAVFLQALAAQPFF
jgi:hypothetical protein